MLAGFAAQAKLNVVTTTTDLCALTKEIGKDLVSVDSIAKGTQDPHYIEAKPSFMAKVSQADLVALIGLNLEMAWLPKVLQGVEKVDLFLHDSVHQYDFMMKEFETVWPKIPVGGLLLADDVFLKNHAVVHDFSTAHKHSFRTFLQMGILRKKGKSL